MSVQAESGSYFSKSSLVSQMLSNIHLAKASHRVSYTGQAMTLHIKEHGHRKEDSLRTNAVASRMVPNICLIKPTSFLERVLTGELKKPEGGSSDGVHTVWL